MPRPTSLRRPVLACALLALSLILLLLAPSTLIRAGRSGITPTVLPDPTEPDPSVLAYFQRLTPEDRPRPLDVAPLGEHRPNIPDLAHRKGLIYTQQGFFNPKDSRAFDTLPADLRPVATHAAPHGRGPGLGRNTGIIQIGEEALRVRGYDAIEAEIRGLGARVLETRSDRALVVKGSEKVLADLVKAPFVEAAIPYSPAFKIEPATGRQQLLNRERSIKKELDVIITPWDAGEIEGLLRDLQAGHGDTVSLGEDGVTILATLTVPDLKKAARDERVKNIGEVPEYWLASYEYVHHPSVMMVGASWDTGSATPYWDAGTDGGGCGNPASPPIGNTDTRNCPTPVAATIVAVLDNGASTDAATLAHSAATLTETQISALIGSNYHRKIRNYQLVTDISPLGSTCDSLLSGGRTHGNEMVGFIAGNASALGFHFQADDLFRGLPTNRDGTARGARVTVQDAGNSSQCTIMERSELGANITPGSLTARMDAAYATGARLHVMGFGIPNWGPEGTTAAGSYTSDSTELDTYLANHLDYQVFVPVGNRGVDGIPDFFDGESNASSDPLSVGKGKSNGLQVSPPSTAKNIVSAGVASSGNPEVLVGVTAQGPATAASLRSAPLLLGFNTGLGIPCTLRSRDNNQGGTVEAEPDKTFGGTSFGAASLAGAAAILQDYFHQGFYPTGDRVQADRVTSVSGAALKAMLSASANFTDYLPASGAWWTTWDGNDEQVARSRGSIVSVGGAPLVLANNRQGYGRVTVSQVLPVANWPDEAVAFVSYWENHYTPEKPALGFLVWDGVDPDGAGVGYAAEPVISNADTQHEHHFRVLGNSGQIRACLAWPDPPGELLVNDLDLELIDPNGRIYDGNVYSPLNKIVGQWGMGRTGPPDHSDTLNPAECVHLTDNPDSDPDTPDGQIRDGIWTLRVKRGGGGALPGQISVVNGPNEDANGNNRLDGGEDLDGDGILDKGGQVYAAVVSGPLVVVKDSTNTAPQFAGFPQSIARMDKIRYHCSDDAVVKVWDFDATAGQVAGAVTLTVRNPAGTLVDTESNLSFSGSSPTFSSMPMAVRLISGATGTPGNGVLEGDTGYTVEAAYADATAGSRGVFGRAPMDCDPLLLPGTLVTAGQPDKPDLLFGGCDRDQFFDANETVTYSVALVNPSPEDEYTDLVADLAACAVPFASDGSCATTSTILTILDTPRQIGRLPVGQPAAITFSVRVSSSPLAQGPRVYLRLGLSQTGNGKLVGRTSFSFEHAVGADRESLHYSTDYPNGSGVITRDLNRSLKIEPDDRPELTLGSVDETIQFSSLFTPLAGRTGLPGAITNVQCLGPDNPPGMGCSAADEAYPALGNFDSGTSDTNSNGILDRHLLVDTSPAGTDLIPWSFDQNNGGWHATRLPGSKIGISAATSPLWHWVKNGTCGFQTQSRSNCVRADGTPGYDNGLGGGCAAIPPGLSGFTGGVWHTGSGVTGACSGGSTPGASCYLDQDCSGGTCTGGSDNPQCGNYGIAFNPATSLYTEWLQDNFLSPVIEKVNQGTDANGFPFTVEFQRLAFNDTLQFRYAATYLDVVVDNNIDAYHTGSIFPFGYRYSQMKIKGPIDPYYTLNYYNQQTFGSRTDPDASLNGTTPALSGDESGFSGFDQASTNPYATKPIIPGAPINLRPFPGPGEVHVGQDTVAGPSRSLEMDLVDFENTWWVSGDPGNRFQIGLLFSVIETAAGGSDGDFGVAVDDVVFEWDEVHPVSETTPACSRIGTGGGEIAAGCRCSTLSVDRTNLYDCNETLAVTVSDSRYAAGAVAPCSLGNPAAPDTIQIQAWSNSEPFPGEIIALTETGNATGVFTGTVKVSGVYNSPGVVFTTPGTENNLFLAYSDSQCDSSQNHLAGQSDFGNLDGDGIQAASGRDGICGTQDDLPALFGPDGVCGFNPATGAIDDAGDNCAAVYNPLQGDVDGDRVGGVTVGGIYYGCDNCPFVYNPEQADGNLDGVGDACDYEDIDGDGIVDDVDNCPDVYNPDQAVGQARRGDACDSASADTDGDGVSDRSDNCVRTYNPGQADSDYASGGSVQPLGNACDGDCLGTCSGGVNSGKPCRWDSANVYGLADNCPGGACGNLSCSAVNDDADIDGVKDRFDNCAVFANPITLPGSYPPVQADDNFNGLGNECDPVGNYDENRDGIPDDVANGPFFTLDATCNKVPLARLVVLQPIVRDRGELAGCAGGPTVQTCNAGTKIGRACASSSDCPGGSCVTIANACGDGDGFGDPGEIVRLGLYLQNITGSDLTGVSLAISTADPDIQCILDPSISIPSFPDGASIDTRALSPPDDPAAPSDGKYFEMVISGSAHTGSAARPARAELALTMSSNEVGGTATPIPVAFLEDVDIPPGASPTYLPAHCDGDLSATGKAGAACVTDADCQPLDPVDPANPPCKPGMIYEDFESPGPSPTGTGGISQNNDFNNTIGFIEQNAAADSDTTVVGKACFGFMEVLGRTAPSGCQIDPDYDTDWHFDLVGAPMPAPKAFHGGKSAHWGRHTRATDRNGDTTPNRQIEAFETNPINLTVTPGTADLLLSFWHIVCLEDDTNVNFRTGESGDRADVQIAVDEDPGPADSFGRWTKLAPFQNVYEHTTQVFSWFGYCEFTPTDGARSTNPEAYGETMCFPDSIWSHSGNVMGTDIYAIHHAQGPGKLGSQGDGVWVQSKFNLSQYLGQRVKIRWIGQGWEVFPGFDSYMEPPAGAAPFNVRDNDDGWWLDSIQLTGAVTTPTALSLEATAIPLTSQCPATPAASCNESLGTAGYAVDFRVSDADGDGVVVKGEGLLLDASQTANPGGCADGVAQFRFTRVDGAGTHLLQDWSSAASLRLGNTADGDLYQVEVRCSSDFSCATPPTGPPSGAVPGGCRVYAGPPPSPLEPSLTFTLLANSPNMTISMPNYLLIGPGTPPALSLPSSVYGHSFLRTDALSVGNGSTDGGISGTCVGSNCTVTQPFRSLTAFASTTGLVGVGSCDIDAFQSTCNAPTPSTISWVDSGTPAAGTLFYYLGDTFTTPGGVAKVFGPFGQSRTASGLGTRTVTVSCP